MQPFPHIRHAIKIFPDGRFKVIGGITPAGRTLAIKGPKPADGHPRAPNCSCAILGVVSAADWNVVAGVRGPNGNLLWLEFVYDPATGALTGH